MKVTRIEWWRSAMLARVCAVAWPVCTPVLHGCTCDCSLRNVVRGKGKGRVEIVRLKANMEVKCYGVTCKTIESPAWGRESRRLQSLWSVGRDPKVLSCSWCSRGNGISIEWGWRLYGLSSLRSVIQLRETSTTTLHSTTSPVQFQSLVIGVGVNGSRGRGHAIELRARGLLVRGKASHPTARLFESGESFKLGRILQAQWPFTDGWRWTDV